jgi:hypothetical protein
MVDLYVAEARQAEVEYIEIDHVKWPVAAKEAKELDSNDIEKILQYVGIVRLNLDRSQLQSDINRAWDFYKGCERDDDKETRTERRTSEQKIAKSIRKSADLLGDSDDPRDGELRTQLYVRAERAEAIARICAAGETAWLESLGLAPRDWFITAGLREIYGRHFGRPANGACFERFVCAVTAQFEESVQVDTIRKAMTAYRRCDPDGFRRAQAERLLNEFEIAHGGRPAQTIEDLAEWVDSTEGMFGIISDDVGEIFANLGIVFPRPRVIWTV